MQIPTTEFTRSVGRPRAFDRAQALSIAMNLFWAQGYEGTSTAQLTTAMGISHPSLYAAFGSKERLFRETVTLYMSLYGQFIHQAFENGGPARESTQTMLHAVARQFSQSSHPRGCMVACGELQLSVGNSSLGLAMTEVRQTAQQALLGYLKVAQKRGELPEAVDTVSLAAFYSMVVQGMAIQARDGAKTALLKKLADQAMLAWPE